MRKEKKIRNRFWSILLVFSMLLSGFQGMQLFSAYAQDPQYGGSVSLARVTAEAVSEEMSGEFRTVTLKLTPSGEGKAFTKGLYWVLYSPGKDCFAMNGSSVAAAEDPQHDYVELPAEGTEISLVYRGEKEDDYRLTAISLPSEEGYPGGLCYTPASLTGLLSEGKFGFELNAVSNAGGNGIHTFFLKGGVFTASSEEYVTVHTDGSAEEGKGVYKIGVSRPAQLPRAVQVGLYHVFWGRNGEVSLSGAEPGECFAAASYDGTGRMIEKAFLKENGRILSARLHKKNAVDHVRFFALDGEGAPIREELDRPAFATVSEDAVGEPGKKGYATVSIADTGSEGSVSLATPSVYSYEPVEDARAIAVVSAKMDGGEGTLDGTAELRIKYRGDAGTDPEISAARLVPGYYNPETGCWEMVPYYIDEDNQEVVIYTDHFSIFGLFDVDSSGTRMAFSKPMDAARVASMTKSTAKAILGPYQNATPAPTSTDVVGKTLEELDGWANGKMMFGVSTYETMKSKALGQDTGGFGKTMTVVGLLGAALSVANSTYNKGLHSAETKQAVANLYTSVGTAALSEGAQAPVAYAQIVIAASRMAYDFYREKQQLAVNDQIYSLFRKWVKKQSWGSYNLADWKREVVDPNYRKYFINGTKGATPYENYTDYLKHVQNAIAAYPHQFAVDYSTGELEKMFPGEVPKDSGDGATLNYVNAVCSNEERDIGLYLGPLFKAQSRDAYIRAVNSLDSYCETIRERLNETITVNFIEDPGEGEPYKTKGCSVVIAGGGKQGYHARIDTEDWKVPFDQDGKATVTFTGTAYGEAGCSPVWRVVHSKSGAFAGSILAPQFDIGEQTYDVTFSSKNFNHLVYVHEEKARPEDDYQYAGYKVRIGDTILQGNTLDENGKTVLSFRQMNYVEAESPNKLEVLNGDGEVVKTVPFSEDTTDVKLASSELLVRISCKNDMTKRHYAGGIAELAATAKGSRQKLSVKTEISKEGTAFLSLSSESYEYYNEYEWSKYYLSVMGGGMAEKREKGQQDKLKPEFKKKVVFNKQGVCDVMLEYKEIPMTDPDYEPLRLGNTDVTLILGGTRPVLVEQGKIGSVRSSDSSIATADRSTFYAKNEGECDIFFTDEGNADDVIKVHVIVRPFIFKGYGIYREWKTRDETVGASETEVKTDFSSVPSLYMVYLHGNPDLGGRITGLTLIRPYRRNEAPEGGEPTYDYYEDHFGEGPYPDGSGKLYHMREQDISYEDEGGEFHYQTRTVYNENSYITVDPFGSSFDWTAIQIEESIPLWNLQTYSFSLTEYDTLTEAFAMEPEYANFIQAGETQAQADRSMTVNEAEAGEAVLEELEAQDTAVSETWAEEETGAVPETWAEEKTGAVPEETVSGAEAIPRTGTPGLLERNREGLFSVSMNGVSNGKLCSLIALAGEYGEFPEQTVTGLESSIRYLDVGRSENGSVKFDFAPDRAGKLTVFITDEDGNHYPAGRIEEEEEKAAECKVSFDPSGGAGTMEEISLNEGESFRLPDCAFTPPGGMVFDCWNLGKAGESIQIYEDTLLRAKWKKKACVVSFDANGGSGTMQPWVLSAWSIRRLPRCLFSKEDASFAGWNTERNGRGSTFAPGDEICVYRDMTLYAVWSSENGQDEPEQLPDELEPEDRAIFEKEADIPEGIWAAGIIEKTFEGSALKQSFRLYDGRVKLQEGTDYTVSYKNNIKAYPYTKEDYQQFLITGQKVLPHDGAPGFDPAKAPQAVVKLKDAYSGTRSLYFPIGRLDISGDEFDDSDPALAFTGKKQTPKNLLFRHGKMLKYQTDYIVREYENPGENVDLTGGEDKTIRQVLTLAGTGNFTGTRQVVLTIAGKKMSVGGKEMPVVLMTKTSVPKIPDQAYTGSPISINALKDRRGNPFSLTVRYQGKTLTEGKDYAVTVSKNTAAGTAQVTLKALQPAEGDGGYAFVGTKRISFRIVGYPMNKVQITGVSRNGYSYGGIPVKPAGLTLTYQNGTAGDRILTEGTDYTVEYRKNDRAGKAEAVFTGNPEKGFTGSKKFSFRIQPLSVQSLRDENKIIINDGEMPEGSYEKGGKKPEFSLKYIYYDNGKRVVRTLKKGTDYTLSYSNTGKLYEDTGFAQKNPPTVTIRGKGNFTGNTKVNYVITKRKLTDHILYYASDRTVSRKAFGVKPSHTVRDQRNGKALKCGTDYTIKACVYEDAQVTVKNGKEGKEEIRKKGDAVDKNDVIPENTRIRLTITGNGCFEGDAEAVLRILPAGTDISGGVFMVADQEYTGRPVLITDMMQFKTNRQGETEAYLKQGRNRIQLTIGKDFEVVAASYGSNTKKGKVQVTFRGKGEYGGYKTVSFRIVSRSVDSWWKGPFSRNVENRF